MKSKPMRDPNNDINNLFNMLSGIMSNPEKSEDILHDFTLNEMNRHMDEVDYDGTGAYGEQLTVEALEKNVPGYFRVIRNLILPINDSATEIDVLMVHEKGIFVFESKNYSGWIFGSKEQKMWTQSLSSNKKYHFYNPIMQNRTHCDAICNLTQVPRQYVMSYVVFSERCSLKKVPENEMYLTIVQRQDMIKEVLKDLDYRNVVFSRSIVDAYVKGFESYLNNEELKNKHLRQVHREGERRDERVCPKCGRKLRISGYNGPILAMCPDFNRCSYTRPATKEEIKENEKKLMEEQQQRKMNEMLMGPHTMDFKNMRIVPKNKM